VCVVPTDTDAVFKALADPTRREILDALFARDGQTVGEICARFESQMGRFGVMKHLSVLIEADLVISHREGRSKRLFLNPVPIELIANRWINKYSARFSAALLELKSGLENPQENT